MSYSALAIKSPIALGVLNLRRHDGHNDGNGCDKGEEHDVEADLHPELFVHGTDHSRHAPNIQSHYTDITNWKVRECIIEQRRLFAVSTYKCLQQQQQDPNYRNVREIEGGNWTQTPLARTSGRHTYDK